MSDFTNTMISSQASHIAVFIIEVMAIIALAFFALRSSSGNFRKGSEKDDSAVIAAEMSNNESLSTPTPLAASIGHKKTVAVLFVDLRDFHKLSGNNPPEEVLAVLNQFFDVTGDAVIASGGTIDNIMGDGLLAVFGHDSDAEVGCRQAIQAVTAIRQAMSKLNKKISKKTGAHLKIGIGIHVGQLLIGKIGGSLSEARKRFIGPAVNIVSKLEEITREKGVQVVISNEAATCAQMPLETMDTEYVILRDYSIPMEVLYFSASEKIPIPKTN